MRSLQEPRLRVAAQGPQALLHVAGLPVQEVQPDCGATARDGRAGECGLPGTGGQLAEDHRPPRASRRRAAASRRRGVGAEEGRVPYRPRRFSPLASRGFPGLPEAMPGSGRAHAPSPRGLGGTPLRVPSILTPSSIRISGFSTRSQSCEFPGLRPPLVRAFGPGMLGRRCRLPEIETLLVNWRGLLYWEGDSFEIQFQAGSCGVRSSGRIPHDPEPHVTQSSGIRSSGSLAWRPATPGGRREAQGPVSPWRRGNALLPGFSGKVLVVGASGACSRLCWRTFRVRPADPGKRLSHFERSENASICKFVVPTQVTPVQITLKMF